MSRQRVLIFGGIAFAIVAIYAILPIGSGDSQCVGIGGAPKWLLVDGPDAETAVKDSQKLLASQAPETLMGSASPGSYDELVQGLGPATIALSRATDDCYADAHGRLNVAGALAVAILIVTAIAAIFATKRDEPVLPPPPTPTPVVRDEPR